MNCIVFLKNRVPAFCITPELIETLTRNCPGCRFTRVESADELLALLPQADLLITWKMESAWYSAASRLRVIFTPAAGHDWIARDPRGVVRIVHGSFHGAIMAETLIAMILHFNRRLNHATALKNKRVWDRLAFSDAPRIAGQQVVIIGYGAIGRHCARLLKAFGCGTVVGVRRNLGRSDLDRDADRIVSMQALAQELPLADHVVAVLPSGPETTGCITADHFRMMKPSAFFYNIGRGNCCDEAVLGDALRQGTIAGAGLDVFFREPLPSDSPLWDLPNVLILPHASAMGPDYMPLFVREVSQRINLLMQESA